MAIIGQKCGDFDDTGQLRRSSITEGFVDSGFSILIQNYGPELSFRIYSFFFIVCYIVVYHTLQREKFETALC